jgi:hypothetical protein
VAALGDPGAEPLARSLLQAAPLSVCDYFSRMVDQAGYMRTDLADDACTPTARATA